MLFIMGCVTLCIIAVAMLMSYKKVLRRHTSFEWKGFQGAAEKLMEMSEGKLIWERGDEIYIINGECVGSTGIVSSSDELTGMVVVKITSSSTMITVRRSDIRKNLLLSTPEKLSATPLQIRKGFIEFLSRLVISIHPVFLSAFTSIPGQPIFVNACAVVTILVLPLLVIGASVSYGKRETISDSVWISSSCFITVVSTCLLNSFIISPAISRAQKYPLSFDRNDKRVLPTADHIPLRTPVVLQRMSGEASECPIQLTLIHNRAIGRVINHGHDGSLTVRFATTIVTTMPDALLVVSNFDGVVQLDGDVDVLPPAAAESFSNRRQSCVELPKSRSRSIFGRLKTRYLRNSIKSAEPNEPNVSKVDPWVPTTYDMNEVPRLVIPDTIAEQIAKQEYDCGREIAAVSILCSQSIKTLSDDVCEPAGIEDVLDSKHLMKIPLKNIVSRLRVWEQQQPLWRLATESVAMGEMHVASTLFILSLLQSNPDLYTILIRRKPPDDLYSGIATLTELRHVGHEWAFFYAIRILGMSGQYDFVESYKASVCVVADILVILKDSHIQQGCEHSNPDQERELLKATALLNLDRFGARDLTDNVVTWQDAIEAVREQDYVRAAFLFMSADHPCMIYFDVYTSDEVTSLKKQI